MNPSFFKRGFIVIKLQGPSLSHQKSFLTKPSIGRSLKIGWILCLHCRPSGNFVTELLIMVGVAAHFIPDVTAWDPQ